MNVQNTIYHMTAQKHSFQNNCDFIQGQIQGQCFIDIQEHKRPILYINLFMPGNGLVLCLQHKQIKLKKKKYRG